LVKQKELTMATTMDGTSLLSRNPWTGGSNGEVAVTPAAAVAGLVHQARDAQAAWAEMAIEQRAGYMTKARQRLLDGAERIVGILHDENGKPHAEGYFSEILPDVDLFAWYIKQSASLLAAESVAIDPLKYPGKSGEIRYEAKGIVAVIAPWNYPVALPLRVIVPALMAGNAVVFKPSEHTPLCGAAVAELFADLPKGVFTLIQGDAEVGRALVAAEVDHVCFSGSVGAGREIAIRCAERFISSSVELGGKDAAIVLADADLDRAADGIAWGGFTNVGQNCASIERVYVEASVAEAFTAKLKARVEALDTTNVGPVQNEAQAAIVRRHLDQALADGARIAAQAPREAGQLGPTVLADVPAHSPVLHEETFGPLLPIVAVSSADEAIRLTNASPYGLTASIWTRNLARGKDLAGKLHTGVVTVNNHSFTGAMVNAPWSGRKDSGLGVTNSHIGLKELVHPKFVLVDGGKGKDLWWFPHTASALTVAKSLVTLMGGQGRKLQAVTSLLSGFSRRWKA
jgi:acyl-CoA reductase-like NAD-dependent aldehyde dehydrogenase